MPVSHRILPWRREHQTVEHQIEPLIKGFRGPRRLEQADLVRRAFVLSAAAHSEQKRKSGEPYIVHPLAVAQIVAELGLDEVTIAAALLHDVVEDTGIGLDELAADFGWDLADIVDGVTKLDRLRFDSKEAQQAATFRKMIIAMASDIRVLVIKLCDRLHNVRTLGALRAAKQERIAAETLDVYAPLAHRLGMQEVKMQLEDLSFAALHPKRYSAIENMVAVRAPERDLYLAQVLADVQGRLEELDIEADITGREKHLYSIYEKMVVKGREFSDIHDLVGIRVLVDTVRDCYSALGSIHATWKPVQGRFKDYIAMPKFNLYQSLHTTVIGPQGKAIEVQIRTKEMHHRAEFGVAAHYLYKDETSTGQTNLPWLSRIVDWEKETSDPSEFMANLKLDLDEDEVFVFTPKGDVVTLAQGSTSIDFAYAVHTEVGHRTVGAKVNGRLVSLGEPLSSGDTVEIFTSKAAGAGPSQDWLELVKSPKAAAKIKQWFSRERRSDAITTGRDEILKAVRREGLPVQTVVASKLIDKVSADLNYADLSALEAAVGEHHISPKAVAARVGRLLEGVDNDVEESLPVTMSRRRRRRSSRTAGVHVEGLDDLLVRLSKCCTPVPGDDIIGFVTRGRGVSVHRSDCANAVSLSTAQNDRVIEVEWDAEGEAEDYVASVDILAYDRSHLLANVAQVFADHSVNIVANSTTVSDDRIAQLRFEFEIADPDHLMAILRSIRSVDGVYDVHRVMPGS